MITAFFAGVAGFSVPFVLFGLFLLAMLALGLVMLCASVVLLPFTLLVDVLTNAESSDIAEIAGFAVHAVSLLVLCCAVLYIIVRLAA